LAGQLTVIYVLLSVELALLVLSLVLLRHSIREHRGRSELIEALSRATRELTRYEYFLSVVDAIKSARRSIAGIVTGRRPTTDLGREAVSNIVKAIREAVSRGVKVRYVMYKSPDRLHVGYLYKMAGAEVKMHENVAIGDLRYMVVDGEISILGLAGESGRGAPTRMGYVVKSSTLAHILLSHFDRVWSEAVDIDEYASEVVSSMAREMPTLGEEAIAKKLDIPVEVVKRLVKPVVG